MFSRIFSLLIISSLAGCAAVPDSIEVVDGTPLAPYQQVAANPDSNVGKEVRWGGVIAKVENLQDKTKLEVVHYPLRSYGRPLVGDKSVGRFRVYVDGFLDPMVYEQGRAMTFTGAVAAAEQGAVGEHQYVFPTLNAKGYHLWKDIQRVEITTHTWPYHHWYGYYGYPMFPVHQRVIIKSSGRSNAGSSGVKSQQSSSQPSTLSSGRKSRSPVRSGQTKEQ